MGVVDRHRHEQLESQLAACQLQLQQQAKLLEMLARSHLGEVACTALRAEDNGVATIVAAMEEMEAQARVAEDVAENMFSYAMRVVPAREVEPRSRLVALCFLLLCLSWQLVFAFGFLDASMLLYSISDYDGFKDVIDISVFWRSSSGVMPTCPHATPRHSTFFSWNFTLERMSVAFSSMESEAVIMVGNLPALFRPGPSKRGICGMSA